MIVLGLGSNLGNSHAYLEKAIEYIAADLLDNLLRSSVYESAPMLPDNAPLEWDKPFLNMAISGDMKKDMSPQKFLEAIKAIETKLGRKKSARWAPREIDIDILAWDDLIIHEDNLEIPHCGLTERAFAIIPFAEIAPDWVHPKSGINALKYASQLNI